MNSTPVAFDQEKADLDGENYIKQFIGLKGTFETWEGETLVGTVEKFEWEHSGRPILRFEDGRWAYGSVDAMFAE